MSTKTVESPGIKTVPFFARFLEDQSPLLAESDKPPADAPTEPPKVPPYLPPLPFTYKFPSDWEDF
ncbi:microviridin/marinostatin family tricyclic proteinase inhibitor [Scytonema sp. UIC 10036]|uniref:microviridin/marinostatin family tricyclic proteinase inhibitor n=1 Tax=Scytonema sp. UIC 10036 TaxID=2304196 RepID=UPI0012DAC940|nr:microviridin/marinostatin family tricyclic proteinase inhibitor [Scytonema sp. UIC 10036]MUG96538.1 microviridin/marinostatin family tricyclic proteinase inhibitor [Scytonema sp. UIC 10036]